MTDLSNFSLLLNYTLGDFLSEIINFILISFFFWSDSTALRIHIYPCSNVIIISLTQTSVCVYSPIQKMLMLFFFSLFFSGRFLLSLRHICLCVVHSERREEMLTGELRDRGGQEVGPANSDGGRSGSSFRRNQLGRSLSQSDVPVTEKNGIL